MMLLEGVYGSFKLTEDSTKKLSEWIKDNNVIEPVEDLHITTTYSKVDPKQEITPSEKNNIRLDHKEFSIATYGRALVIEVESKDLETIHKSAIDSGASYDYETYKPHITISYNAEANENIIPLLFPPDFDIVLSHEEVEPLKEIFTMEPYYNFWGWIKPDGSLLLPTEKMRYSYNDYSHIDVLKKSISSYDAAYKLNYIRFYVETALDRLVFDCPNTVPASIVEKGYKNILYYVRTKQLDIMSIFRKTVPKLSQFKFYLVKRRHYGEFESYDSGDSIQELIVKLEKASKKKLKEEFEMDRHYKMWGWVKPNGSLLLPTEKMRIDDKNHTHTSLFRDNTKLDYNGITYEVAYEQNYIRFFIDEDNLLIFDCPNTVPISTVEKGYKNILSYVRTKQLDIMKIFNHKLTKLNGFVYFLAKFDEKRKIFMEYDHGRSFPELISALENIQESDLPANSTANIATYAKPMTFKMFKRKMDLK